MKAGTAGGFLQHVQIDFGCASYYKLVRLKVVRDTLSSRLSPQASLPWKHRETVAGMQNIALVSGSGHVVHMLPG